jgi:phospholipase C
LSIPSNKKEKEGDSMLQRKMLLRKIIAMLFALGSLCLLASTPARAEGNIQKVKHIIILMQENHSFDNYFGALAYAPGSPYHSPDRDRDRDENGGCRRGDHQCVDGLSCVVGKTGDVTCFNSNVDENSHTVLAFHDPRRCVGPDLDHSWFNTHREANFLNPNTTLDDFRADGFVRVNDLTEQVDKGGAEDPTEDQTMNFYNQDEIPFYYDLAQKFAINDRYFSSVLGPTFPNRSYLMAGTSFGHLTTSDTFPPGAGYKPITGTIFDLLDANHITWGDYFQDFPQAFSFRTADPHYHPLTLLFAQLAGTPGAGELPQVIFVDPNFGIFGRAFENDEHPPTDIQKGQAHVSRVINALRNSSAWPDSILFVTYDEHGGSYDHVRPPRARQDEASNPDGISPGQCADLSNVPASLQPGGGAECSKNFLDPSNTDTSVKDAEALCPALAANPTGAYPENCANFDQLGIRVPFIAVSPFSKQHYVSHTAGDHTSLLALIEKRFLTVASGDGDDQQTLHLTKRDAHASTLEDMFDFDQSPSLNTTVGQAAPPAVDCTPK